MTVNDPSSIACIIFQSAKINYILPQNIIKDIIPMEKTAIFLKLKGLIIGRQKYQSETVPIINLKPDMTLTFSDFSRKLLVLHIIRPDRTKTMLAAILLDKDPTYILVDKNEIANTGPDANHVIGTSVLIGSRNAVIPDLKYLSEALAKEI